MNIGLKPSRLETIILAGAVSLAAAAENPVSFRKEIAPILVAKCVACHSAEKTKGGYQLHTFETLMKGGESREPAITPGQPARSKLFSLITAKDPEDRMPQKDDPLASNQVALIERWINEGATFDGEDRRASLATLVPSTATAQAPARYPRPLPILALAFSPDGKELASGGYYEITIWNPADGTLLRRIAEVAQQTQALAYSADGKWLALAGGTPGRLGEVKLCDAASGKVASTLARTADMMLALAFSPDGKRLAAGGADNVIRIFGVPGGKEELRLELHADWVMGLAFSPDGSQLASASRDKSARIIDATTGELEQTYLGHGEAVFSVAFEKGGKRVFSAGRDKQIHLWQTSDAKTVEQLKDFDGEVLKILVKENRLWSVSANRQARLFGLDGKKPQLLKTFSGHKDIVYALALHEPSHQLATGSYDGEVRIWNAETGELLRTFVAAPGFPSRAPDLHSPAGVTSR